MESTLQPIPGHDAGVLPDQRPAAELSLVEIAERLERITRAIEAEREKERAARRIYNAAAERVEANVSRIRGYAQSLVNEQRRRMVSFDGMFVNGGGNGVGGGVGGNGGGSHHLTASEPKAFVHAFDPHGESRRMSIGDAVLRVLNRVNAGQLLTTEEIAAGLGGVGYSTRAVQRSLKSALNQALAKLCRDRLVRRFRTDGTEISAEDGHSRARKYLAAREEAAVQNGTSQRLVAIS